MKSNIDLLWTGGWDSTFCLLQLLIIHKKSVVPHYLIDPNRPSTGVEIMTMDKIKKQIIKEFPFTKKLLKPTKFYSESDIPSSDKVIKSYNSFITKKHLGVQYKWLANLCESERISEIYLSTEKPYIKNINGWDTEVYPYLKKKKDNDLITYFLDESSSSKDFYPIFKYFNFPLIKTTKHDMLKIAEKQSLDHIMSMTWFCHTPTANLKPCGLCSPCRQLEKHNFNWRLPLKSRTISYFNRKIYLPLKAMLRPTYVLFKK